MRVFNPMGSPMNRYLQVPADVLEDVGALETWVREALEVAGRAKPRAKRR
ncbi:hypothetical protein BH20GEM1_BH20GEM1_09970 [soil metagenome]